MSDSTAPGFLAPAAAPVVLEDPDLTDLVQSVVAGITGIALFYVRPRWQPTPPVQPAADIDWCAVGITLRRDEGGLPYIEHAAAGLGTDTLLRHQVLDVLASFYGPNAGALADRLFDGLWISQNRETLLLADAALVGADDVLTLTEAINGVFVPRADLGFQIRRQRRRSYPVRNLLEAPFNLEADPP